MCAREPLRPDVTHHPAPPTRATLAPFTDPETRLTLKRRHSYHSSHHLTDSSSGSISTSPSSAASSLQYTTYPPNQCNTLPSYAHPVILPQSFATGFTPSVTTMYVPLPSPSPWCDPLDAAASPARACSYSHVTSRSDANPTGLLPPPLRGSLAAGADAADRDYSNTAPLSARSQLPPHAQPNHLYHYTDTPRAVHAGGLQHSGFAYPAMASTTGPGYGTTAAECQNFPWPELTVLAEMTCEGTPVTPELHCKVEKGFFPSTLDNKWTCYRRNYFSVTCHFTLTPSYDNARMYLKRNGSPEMIQALGMKLSAAVDGAGGKSIELVQHTPKRDNGPKTKIEVTKVSPHTPAGQNNHSISPNGVYTVPMGTFHPTGVPQGPFLPLQDTPDPNATGVINNSTGVPTPQLSYASAYGPMTPHRHPLQPGQQTSHTFERVQFKQATANNGKRRASQQYFHLIVELYADVRKDGADNPNWVKVAHRVSDKIVVRGRSPSHYQNEGQHGQAGRGGSSSGANGYSGSSGGHGGMNTGGFRGTSTGYGNGLNGSSAGGYGRSTGYSMHGGLSHHHSSSDSSSPNSNDSASEDTAHPFSATGHDAIMTDSERSSYQEHEGYRYYPAPLYESTLPPLSKVEGGLGEPRHYAVKTEYGDAVAGAQQTWTGMPSGAGLSRFQGVDTSRGHFPMMGDVTAGFS